jgi:cysteine desulfurase / selenocysteine lyase
MTTNNRFPTKEERILSPLPLELEAAQASPVNVDELSRIVNQLFDETMQNPLRTESGRTETGPLVIPANSVEHALPDLFRTHGTAAMLPTASAISQVDHHPFPPRRTSGLSSSTLAQPEPIDPYASMLPSVSSAEGFYFLKETVPVSSPQVSQMQFMSRPIKPEVVDGIRLASKPFDVQAVRQDFPILSERVNGQSLVWLDNAATTQKPRAVIERIRHFYEHENSNIHRAAHELAARSTDAYEGAREKVRQFINAASSREIVFVRGGTEAINLVAKSWGASHLQSGDEIVLTQLEHHANIVPWQQVALEKGASLRVAPVDSTGQIILEEYEKLLSGKTKIVAFTQVSNALGTITPAREMVAMAHRHGAKVLVDAAQSVAHSPTDVQSLDSDWLVFSGHKMFGPTGIGVLYGREELLNSTPPWQGGGNMIQDVTFERTVYQSAPARFEAGTGNIADAVGLGAAIDYLQSIGIENIERYEHDLMQYTLASLARVPGLQIIGSTLHKAGAVSFVIPGFEPLQIAQTLNQQGIAVRAGHHCAQPILRKFGLEATVRPSLALYNTCSEIDVLASALKRLVSRRSPI